MPVFISYHQNERLDAFILNERLLLEGIPTQLVPFDSEGQTHDDLQGSFCQHMADATHWIGVLCEAYTEDLWTAWLLGAAAMADRRVTFYHPDSTELPQGLRKWPVMRERAHIDLFVRAYHDEQTFGRAMASPAGDGVVSDRDNADFFHADLKAKIRRGF
ncbi:MULTISPECIES: molecular chaperone Tir [Pseudomonas]|uniref:molecular chaperone Tir n=1 Tax=Pseudomonas TaxID=286 RepID=UPI000B58C8E2|nr:MULTISPECIES: molecular chaperone Tir [Pseudomonas]MCL8298907.1 molecular chaperone Tir [Pseudomonas mosselii]MCL8337966.1 molecular chaperone Tir [Pseudomonas mosselii]MCU9530359.1 molecular chaperone Tir [Pseudomonas mosselii]MCU9537365.1 molecular chaperone Tir [Pseudomonas mosselii]MCU9543408.1 molecular chaperone Tir [Pseudomonas mosselii]